VTWVRDASLLWKIWISQCAVMAAVITAVCLAVDHYGAAYLMALMNQFHLSPAPLHYMFTGRLHFVARSAGVAGALLAAPVCFFLTMGIVKPLKEIVEMTGRVAAGDRTARLPTKGPDEVKRLAGAFNELVDRLRQKDQMQNLLVSSVAHELRTPLTNIRGYLEALVDEVLSPSREIFQSLHEETLLLTKVVDNLFDLAEANAAANSLELRPTNLAALVERAISTCRPQIDAKRITVEVRFRSETSQVVADSDRIVQAVRNLLQNAVEHSPPDGHIQIVADDVGDAIQLVFLDDGDGIDEADLPFVFDRFFRGRRRSSQHGRGAGLGLAIVKELVTAHGGRVGAERSDTGAHVWFTLPKSLDQWPQAPLR